MGSFNGGLQRRPAGGLMLALPEADERLSQAANMPGMREQLLGNDDRSPPFLNASCETLIAKHPVSIFSFGLLSPL